MTLREELLKNIDIKSFNKATEAIDKRDFPRAITLLKRVLKRVEFKEVLINLGVAYKGINDIRKCREYFLKANDPSVPDGNGNYTHTNPMALTNAGLSYFAEERDDLAEICYKQVLADNPLYYEAIWNLSLAKLRQYCSNKFDDLPLAWQYYTYRFKRDKAEPLKNDNPKLLMWDFTKDHRSLSYQTSISQSNTSQSSSALPENSIVVLMEQGMGDNIMFGRYLPYLKNYFDEVWVQCTPELNYIFSGYKTCIRTSDANARYAVPMCSLGKILDYIPPGEWLADKYIEKKRSDALEIMCIWKGNDEHVNALNRNVPAGYFDKLHKFGNLHSVIPRKDYSLMEIVDWETTTKYLEKIDIVVTIDSSVAHLCGSLGKPCLVIMPLLDTDFRWGDSSMGFSNKWYNSVKVIRNNGSWDSAFKLVETCLSAL